VLTEQGSNQRWADLPRSQTTGNMREAVAILTQWSSVGKVSNKVGIIARLDMLQRGAPLASVTEHQGASEDSRPAAYASLQMNLRGVF
jgi:hypothetical protein